MKKVIRPFKLLHKDRLASFIFFVCRMLPKGYKEKSSDIIISCIHCCFNIFTIDMTHYNSWQNVNLYICGTRQYRRGRKTIHSQAIMTLNIQVTQYRLRICPTIERFFCILKRLVAFLEYSMLFLPKL